MQINIALGNTSPDQFEITYYIWLNFMYVLVVLGVFCIFLNHKHVGSLYIIFECLSVIGNGDCAMKQYLNGIF